MESSITEHADMYLDAHNHDVASYEHVREVLDRYEHLVSLARERALGELVVRSNVISLDSRRAVSLPPSTPA